MNPIVVGAEAANSSFTAWYRVLNLEPLRRLRDYEVCSAKFGATAAARLLGVVGRLAERSFSDSLCRELAGCARRMPS